MNQGHIMTNKFLVASCILFLTVFSVANYAEEDPNIEKLKAQLIELTPAAADAKISKSPLENVYQVEMGGQLVFVIADGTHLMIGDMLNTKTKENLGERFKQQIMLTALNEVSTDKMIIFGPKDSKKHITVFTDIDCGYCRKLHNEVPTLNQAGIQVRYLAYPRAGVGSNSFKKYVSVWCADDRQKALTDAKAGLSVPSKECDNPITETFELGNQVGVRGTPTVILSTGKVMPGYIPAQTLIQEFSLQ